MQGSGPGWNLQIVDQANLTTGQSHQYCLKALGGPLTVTLVWHDYLAAVSAKTALVNDLDLTVRAAGLVGFPLLVRSHSTMCTAHNPNLCCASPMACGINHSKHPVQHTIHQKALRKYATGMGLRCRVMEEG